MQTHRARIEVTEKSSVGVTVDCLRRLPDPRENKKPIFNSGDAEVHGCAAFNPVKAVDAVCAGRGVNAWLGVHAANKRSVRSPPTDFPGFNFRWQTLTCPYRLHNSVYEVLVLVSLSSVRFHMEGPAVTIP